MASWGLLMGVGQGLQSAAGLFAEKGKTELLDKLKQDAEVRADTRKKEAEQRELLSPDPTNISYEPTENGGWLKVRHNKGGGVFEKTIASPEEARQRQLQVQKDKLTMDQLAAEAAMAQKKAEAFDETLGLERRLTESQIQRNRDTGLAATMRADKTDDKSESRKPTASEISSAMIEANQAVIDDLDIDPSVAKMIADRIAPQLVERAKAGDVRDPSAEFLEALRIIKNLPSKGKETL